MPKKSKFHCLDEKFLLKFCLISTLLAILVKICGLCLPHWFSQGESQRNWKGNMFSVYSSGGLISPDTYISLSDFYSSNSINYPSEPSNTTLSIYEVQVLSLKFSSLSSGMASMLSFAILSLFTKVFICILLMFCKKFPWPFCCTSALLGLQWVFEVGFIVCLTFSSKITFLGDCQELAKERDSLTVTKTCGEFASVFNVAVSVGIVLFDMGMIWAFKVRIVKGQEKTYDTKDEEEEKEREIDEHEEKEIMPMVLVDEPD